MNILDEEKKFYERFWNLLNDPQLMLLFKRYGPMVLRRSSVLEGFETFLRHFDIRGDRCVEIGTLRGLTAIVLSRYFKEVVSVDIIDNPMKYEILEYLGVSNVRFINVKSNAEKASIISGLEFDAAYVDGDHTHDTEADFVLVKRGGRVIFHEYWDAQPPVKKLVDRLDNVSTQGKFALWIA